MSKVFALRFAAGTVGPRAGEDELLEPVIERLPPLPGRRARYAAAAIVGSVAGLGVAVLESAPPLAGLGLGALAGALARLVYRRVHRHAGAAVERWREVHRQGRLRQLARDLEELARVAPDAEEARRLAARRGLVELFLNESKAALQWFKEADLPGQADGRLLNNVGVALAGRQRWDEAYQALRAALRERPDDPAILLNLARVKLGLGDAAGVLRYLARAGAHARTGIWRHLWASCLGRQMGPAAAREAWLGLLHRHPGDAVALNGLATTLVAEHRPTEAAALFDTACHLNPNLGAAWHNRALVRAERGQVKAALRDLARAERLLPECPAVPAARALVHLRANTGEAAAHAAREALVFDEVRPEVYLNLSESHLVHGRWQEALAAAEQALRQAPRETAARLNYGCALFGLRRWEPALDAFRRAAQDESWRAVARANAGLTLALAGRLDEALEELEAGLGGDSLHGLRYRAYAYHINGRLDEAYAAYQAVSRLDWSPEVSYHLGLCEYARGEWQAAVDGLERALAERSDLPLAWFPYGCALVAVDKVDQAVEWWEKAIEVEPECPELLCNLGLVYYRRGDSERAVGLLRKAYFARPNDPLFSNNLALAYAQAGRYELAAEFFENTVADRPKSVVARCNLGLAYYLNGEVEKAIDVWTEAATVDRNYFANRRRRDLDNTFDDVEVALLELDWTTRALPLWPASAGYRHDFLSELPDLPWHVLATKDMLPRGEDARLWRNRRLQVVLA